MQCTQKSLWHEQKYNHQIPFGAISQQAQDDNIARILNVHYYLIPYIFTAFIIPTDYTITYHWVFVEWCGTQFIPHFRSGGLLVKIG